MAKTVRIYRVISGGQTGADIAGIKAAKRMGVQTGGFIPAGFRTEAGPKLQYARRYGLVETTSSGYPDRTRKNVQAADITLIFSPAATSRGSHLTKRYCLKYQKPFVWCSNLSYRKIEAIIDKIQALGIKKVTVNVAGNREESSPGIEKKVYGIMKLVIKTFNKKSM